MSWVQIERHPVYSFFYDGAMLCSYFGTALSLGYILFLPSGNSSNGGSAAIAAASAIIYIPAAIILTKARFREFGPLRFSIEKHIKVQVK